MTQQIDGTKLDGSKFAKSYAIDSKEIYVRLTHIIMDVLLID